MNRYYPVFLDLSGRDVLVVGGGAIAARKVRTLLRYGARVTVAAPRIRPEIGRLASRKKIRLLRRGYKSSDLSGRDMVYCSTDDEALNAAVGLECAKRKILVNVVDRPKYCSFIVPAIVQRGDVTFAISTGGASPALAKFLMGQVREKFGGKVGRVAAELKKMRSRLLKVPMAQRKVLVNRFIKGKLSKTLSKLKG